MSVWAVETAAGYMTLWIYSSGLITPVVFFSFSFFTNFLCTGLILWRTLHSAYGSAPPKLMSRRFTLDFRKVIEALLQSAAVYSAASIALVATNFESPHYGFVVCLGVFPSLIVSDLLLTLQVQSHAADLRTPGFSVFIHRHAPCEPITRRRGSSRSSARWREASGTTPAVRGSPMAFAAPTVSLPVTVPKAWDVDDVESNDSLAEEEGLHHPDNSCMIDNIL
ncbi:hypothetical protein NUW54_g6289 [Trametes sanguinea]|uniref:Uncharacterized protein n=1 Tax=Trametes sanguinea TaxID=158606 RepID=A0ACC1PTP3_9APHY|nr:hypothetical protein NUW54_g6289 [Trametes sanguinea]